MTDVVCCTTVNSPHISDALLFVETPHSIETVLMLERGGEEKTGETGGSEGLKGAEQRTLAQ